VYLASRDGAVQQRANTRNPFAGAVLSIFGATPRPRRKLPGTAEAER
jgi:hypothetical protein